MIASQEATIKFTLYSEMKDGGLNPPTTVYNCTDEILISDVNSHKTSVAIIYICLKNVLL